MTDYAKLPKKNFLYKTRLAKKNPVTRHDAAILIPKDRPQPTGVSGTGQTVAENYFSESEDRWIMRLAGPLPARAATATVTYKGGGKESFRIDSLAGRTEYAPGPWKGAQSPDNPTTSPAPTNPQPSESLFRVTDYGIVFSQKAAPYIEQVFVVEGVNANGQAKQIHRCTKSNGTAWRGPFSLSLYTQPAFYAVDVVDRIEHLIPHSVRGWIYINAKGEIVQFGAKPLPPPVPVTPKPPEPKPAPTPATTPSPAKDAELTATGLRLAPDLVPLVAKVIIIEDAETNRTKPPKHICTYLGNGIWGTGKPLSSYRAAVYQLFWKVEPPNRIPHHQGFPGAIKNVSHVTQAGKWKPESTRNP